jgi:site-specific DNA recombinase
MQRREAKSGVKDRKRPRRPKERNDTGENPHRNDLSGVGAGICGFVGLDGGRLAVRLKSADDEEISNAGDDYLLSIPWQKPPSRRSRQILIPHGMPKSEIRPTRIERRARLVSAIARGRRWLDEIVSGSVTDVQQIASRRKCSVRQVNMTISLAFLAPDLVRAAVEGRLPRGIGVERLRDAPPEWSRQFEALGLNPQ